MKIRAKAILEGYAFTDETKDRVYHWASEKQMNVYPSYNEGKPVLVIPESEGVRRVELGDYIIVKENGRLTSYKEDTFKQLYEVVTKGVERLNILIETILEWWKEHEGDVRDGDFNVYDWEPEFVTTAKKD